MAAMRTPVVATAIGRADGSYRTIVDRRGLAHQLPPGVSQVAHPAVSDDILLFAGQQACGTLQGIRSFDMAEQAVYCSILNRTGVIPNMAEVGTIVHVAVDHLCPEVGYP